MEKHEDVQYCFQDRNSSCRKAFLSTSIHITLYIFFSLISAVTVFLNLLVIISISHFKQLHTTTNLLILSLAVSDLLVGLIVIPVVTVAILEPCWGFGEHFCAFHFYISFLCASLSLGNLVLISIDRYVAVCDPLLYHSKITTTRITCYHRPERYFQKRLPVCLVLKLYRQISLREKQQKLLSIVVFNYFICWIPSLFIYHFYSFLIDIFSSYFIIFLPLVNSLINPIIYALFYPWFKVTAKLLLHLKIRRS
ncbi:trace amine-associated receptor 13c-like [Oncorhynchus nerka]|uniref:trace amine-associated receptor 13c-like n=1 Tax=Oncorhynchus nerka TaxID=8023 RepID=UPI0031B81A4A